MNLFKVVGVLAHSRPKNAIDVIRIVKAEDIQGAMKIYQKKLKGVKKARILSVSPIIKKGGGHAVN